MSPSEELIKARGWSNFSTDFTKARKVSTLSGDLCKFVGFLLPVGAALLAMYAIGMGELAGSIGFIGIALLLLISGAPLIAFGNNANELKRQTELLALRTWQAQKRITPELEDFRVY